MTASTHKTYRAHVPKRSELPFAFRALRNVLELAVRVSPTLAQKISMQLFSTPVGKARVRLDSPIMQAARQSEVLFAEGHLAVYEWGDADQPTVLLIHGWRSKAEQFRHMVEPLLEAGLHVVAFDLPAHGNSSGKTVTPLVVKDALRTLSERFGDLHGMVAHSFGAYGVVFLLHESADFPVNKIVLMGAPDHVHDITAGFANQLALSDRVLAVLNRGLESMVDASTDDLRSANVMAGCTKPGLIVHDRQDTDVAFTCGEAIAEGWDSAELYATTSLGHHKILRDPTVLRIVASFLKIMPM